MMGGATSAAAKNSSGASQFVKKTIASAPVVVFSKSYCPYCAKTKRLLSSLKVKAVVLELDQRSDGSAIQSVLVSQFKHRTVPAVFVNGRLIGGNDDTQKLHRQGKLVPLIRAATAKPATATATAASAPATRGAATKRGNPAATLVDTTVASAPVVVFSKSYCPFCTRTKRLLSQLGANATVLELDQRDDGAAIQAALLAKTGQRTVPSVWVGGKHLGGNDSTQATHRQGKLVPLIKAASSTTTRAGQSAAAAPGTHLRAGA